MTAPLVLNGNLAAKDILQRLRSEVSALASKNLRVPGLAVLQVGENPASTAYIRQKKNAAEGCGFYFIHKKLPRSSTPSDIAAEINAISRDPLVDGLILQLPLDTEAPFSPAVVSDLLEKVPPSKDADGLHSFNQGKLFTGESTPDKWSHPIPATPLGVSRLLEFYNINPSGLNITVVGRSRLVGLPVSIIMAHKQGTVTVCNRQTQNLAEKTKSADLLIVAAGKKHLILPEHIKNNVILIDVGIHLLGNKKITGDIHPDCYQKAKAYSPVPGGVGPMTVASLMENTFRLRLSNLA